VRVVVFDEPDLTVEQRIDDLGEVRLALHGPLRLAGLSPRDAERRIEQAYIEARLLRAPQATLSILDYRLRTALALGQVRSAGNVAFPAGTESVDIVEFITLAGGFTETARTGNVQVFRARPDGTEQAFTVDVGALLDKRRSEENRGGFQVLPGDRVLISQRVF
jgi:polysaccharide export outer membrane protein